MTTMASNPNTQELDITAAPPLPVHRLRPRPGWVPVNFSELWYYRELLTFFVKRDLMVRYKQTALGVTWALIQPVMTMCVFTLLFHYILGVSGDKTASQYAIATFAALLPWQLFEYALTQSGNSLVASERLITKIYFPRLILPLSSVLSGMVDFVIGLGLLGLMMLWFGYTPSIGILLLPVFALLALTTALSIGLWLSALNVEYRDVKHTIPFITKFMFFITPVTYSMNQVMDKLPETWQTIYALNPMCAVVEGFRWALLGQGTIHGQSMIVSLAATLVLLVGGLFYFRRLEKSFADII